MKYDRPFEILDAAMFYNSPRVDRLMRHLYRLGYDERKAEKVFKTWVTKREYTIVDVPTVVRVGDHESK